MRRKFCLLIVLFVLGISGCPSPGKTVTNTANESVVEPTNSAAPEIVTDSIPTENSKNDLRIAVGNRRLWTEAVNTPEGFDHASRAAILHYALELEKRKSSEIKTANRPSVNKWLDKELNLARQNYQLAAKTCQANDWTCLENSDDFIARARALQIPATLTRWRENIAEFVRIYVAEQIRLAAIFPNTTSEIDLFNAQEWSGDEMSDRKFFLTFDDGPTATGGNTDQVVKMLDEQKKTAVFFVLGQSFTNRQKADGSSAVAKLYQGQCLAAHGWEHLSHEKRSKYAAGTRWQTSVTDTVALLRESVAETSKVLPLFRPPYGQRKADSGDFFQKEGLQVALWNLDSQDWNAEIKPDDIINRMQILMLIKRRGVLLFHDVHPKAQKAVPVIIAELGNAVEWGDCSQIGK
jgi:peptidoglycan/xylan/chitin deacetylase (PgdA/CDA1 family)